MSFVSLPYEKSKMQKSLVWPPESCFGYAFSMSGCWGFWNSRLVREPHPGAQRQTPKLRWQRKVGSPVSTWCGTRCRIYDCMMTKPWPEHIWKLHVPWRREKKLMIPGRVVWVMLWPLFVFLFVDICSNAQVCQLYICTWSRSFGLAKRELVAFRRLELFGVASGWSVWKIWKMPWKHEVNSSSLDTAIRHDCENAGLNWRFEW